MAALGKRAAGLDPVDEAALRVAIDGLYVEAAEMVTRPRLLGTLEKWVAKAARELDESATASALVLAMDLEIFTPSLGGALIFDRLARRRRLGEEEAAALAALKRARFTPMRIQSVVEGESFVATSLFTHQRITVLNPDVQPAATGIDAAARLVPLADGRFMTIGMVTPLDATGLAIALDFLRPGKAPNDQRCAAAVFKQVVRHGTPIVPGFNDLADELDETGDVELVEGPSVVSVIGVAVIKLKGAEPADELVEQIRAAATPMAVVEACFKSFAGRTVKEIDMVGPFRWIAETFMETLQRRAAAGSGDDRHPFDTIADLMDHEIDLNDYPRGAKALFEDLRRGFERARPKRADDELTRVVERIRALRAKTLDQGCTEAEAVAAAAKVAELLDRYGLTLSEIDIKGQACEGVGIDSTRKRRSPLDDCLDAIAAFCDCRAWQETSTAGTIRSVFFGMPADVEGAHYLYERVEAAFGTETRAFQTGPLYANAASSQRRTATTSFQVGLANGICAKLRGLMAERDGVRSASGRDLVLVKASTVEDELAKLGMSFRSIKSKGHRVYPEAYKEGQVAGQKFEARDSLE